LNFPVAASVSGKTVAGFAGHPRRQILQVNLRSLRKARANDRSTPEFASPRRAVL